MTGQGSATREGLLAIGVWALVWALAGVDATVAGQRTRVTERLFDVSGGSKAKQSFHTFPHRSHM
jgi:hypothetical protein